MDPFVPLAKRLTSPERWEVKQLITSSTLDVLKYPDLDENFHNLSLVRKRTESGYRNTRRRAAFSAGQTTFCSVCSNKLSNAVLISNPWPLSTPKSSPNCSLLTVMQIHLSEPPRDVLLLLAGDLVRANGSSRTEVWCNATYSKFCLFFVLVP
ncbi:hypothetical protein C8F01DRAFT_490334 [Mycena amicta]|nr:hypothetical protein C8F01DRAFT_490334 [Mycena amicta]